MARARQILTAAGAWRPRGRAGWLNLLTGALLLLTVARMVLACGTTPILGYANNLDFFRQSACVGVWQSYPGSPRIAAHPAGPVDELVYDGHRDAYFCMRSSDNLFPWAVGHWFGKHARFGLHDLGLAKAGLSAALMLLVLVQPVGAGARLVIAAALLLVFGDSSMLAFFNTLYVDASGLIFTTVLAGLIAALVARTRAPGWASWCGLVFCVVWLGCVKAQYAPLAGALGVAAAGVFWVRWRDRARAGALAGVAVLTPALFVALNRGPTIMRVVDSVDVTDTLLEAVLPHASDSAQALRVLGLPAGCAPDIGQNSYTLTPQQRAACPDIGSAGRARLLALFVTQPGTLVGPLAEGFGRARPGYIGLAHFERPDSISWRFRVLDATSVSTWLRLLPDRVYEVLICLAPASAALLGLGVVWRVSAAGAALMLLGGCTVAYAVASCVFGDGYTELRRHEAVAFVGLMLWLTGAIALLVARLNTRSASAN